MVLAALVPFFRSPSARAKAPFVSQKRVKWSEWRDLNPRPLAPHASALANCATPRRANVLADLLT